MDAKTARSITTVEHMLTRNVFGGSPVLATAPRFLMSAELVTTVAEEAISERAVKVLLSELQDNCYDQAQRTAGMRAPHRMTRVVIVFTGEWLVVWNDGEGMSTEPMAGDAHKRTVAEVLGTVPMSGTNFGSKKQDAKAGENGVGFKLCLAHALESVLDTVDGRHKRRFTQATRHNMTVIEPPVITAAGAPPAGPAVLADELRRRAGVAADAQYTMIAIKPDYAALGWGFIDPDDPYDRRPGKPAAQRRQCRAGLAEVAVLEQMLRMRAALLAVALAALDKKRPAVVTFNGAAMPFRTLADVAATAWPAERLMTGAVRITRALPVDEAAAVRAAERAVAAGRATPAQAALAATRLPVLAFELVVALDAGRAFSLVNGVPVEGGTHVDRVHAELLQAVKDRAKDLFPDGKLPPQMTSFAVLLAGEIPEPGWGGGQLKTSVKMAAREFVEIAITPAVTKTLADQMYEVGLVLKNLQKPKAAGVRVRASRYSPADRLGATATLLISEGSSADTMIQIGRMDRKRGLGTRDYGTYTLNGVPMNALKEVKLVAPRAGGPTIAVRSHRLETNQTLQEVAAIVGLDYRKTYATAAERATLSYGALCLVVDEDLDGKGNIASLFLAYIYQFWPALFGAGVVKRLRTPLVRLFPRAAATKAYGRAVREFLTEQGAQEFLAAAERAAGVPAAQLFDLAYYKGLGGHDSPQIINIFANFARNVVTYALDAADEFAVYYGEASAGRKRVLTTPARGATPEEAAALARGVMPCSYQLGVDTKEFCLDRLTRSLPGLADGFVITRRRVMNGALQTFGRVNTAMKVFQFAGRVASEQFYHHGNQSLEECITHMAQHFVGLCSAPMLQGSGVIGNRMKGPSSHASARYIGVRLNKAWAEAVLHADETWLLPHLFEDGVRTIPKYFVPVVPLVLFRTESIPATGWKFECWARDVAATIAAIRRMVAGAGVPAAAPALAGVGGAGETPALAGVGGAGVSPALLPPDVTGFTGAIVRHDGREYSVGRYAVTRDARGVATELVVTELPLRLWTNTFIAGFWKVEEVKDPNRPGAVKRIPVQEYSDEYKELFEGKTPVSASDEATIHVTFRLRPGAYEKIVARGAAMETARVGRNAGRAAKLLAAAKVKVDDDDDGEGEARPGPEPEAEAEAEPEAVVVDAVPGVDAVHRFLGLVKPMPTALNLMHMAGAVREYPTYEAVLADWYGVRRAFVGEVLARRRALLDVRLRYLREVLRFCREYEAMGLGRPRVPVAEMEAALARAQFARVNLARYNRPGYADEAPTDRLMTMVFTAVGTPTAAGTPAAAGAPTAASTPAAAGASAAAEDEDEDADAQDKKDAQTPSYKYLLRLSTLDRSAAAQARLEAQIAEAEAAAAAIDAERRSDPFPGASQWLRDLDEVLAVYQTGVAQRWTAKKTEDTYV